MSSMLQNQRRIGTGKLVDHVVYQDGTSFYKGTEFQFDLEDLARVYQGTQQWIYISTNQVVPKDGPVPVEKTNLLTKYPPSAFFPVATHGEHASHAETRERPVESTADESARRGVQPDISPAPPVPPPQGESASAPSSASGRSFSDVVRTPTYEDPRPAETPKQPHGNAQDQPKAARLGAPRPTTHSIAATLPDHGSRSQHQHVSGNWQHVPVHAAQAALLQPSFKCSHCRRTFPEQFDLDMHLATEHSDDLVYNESPSSGHHPPAIAEFSALLLEPPRGALKPFQLGYYRGIQGENNSCYLDATLFAMFAFASDFDGVLKKTKEELSPEVNSLVDRLRTEVINDLRRRCYVDSWKIIQCRRILHVLGFPGNDFSRDACEERDIEELLSALFGLLRVPPLVGLASSKDAFQSTPTTSHMLQLVSSREMIGNVCTVQTLLDHTLDLQQLVFTKCSKVLIVLLPRHSKTERALSAIIPTVSLSIQAFAAGTPSKSVRYELFSMCCIALSHYVSYSRPLDTDEWYFADSMADRVHKENVPVVRRASGTELLADQDRLLSLILAEEKLPEDLARMTQDCSICFYRRVF